MRHIPSTSYRLLAAKYEPYQNVYLFTKNTEEVSEKKKKKSHQNGPVGRRRKKDRESNGIWQKNERSL